MNTFLQKYTSTVVDIFSQKSKLDGDEDLKFQAQLEFILEYKDVLLNEESDDNTKVIAMLTKALTFKRYNHGWFSTYKTDGCEFIKTRFRKSVKTCDEMSRLVGAAYIIEVLMD